MNTILRFVSCASAVRAASPERPAFLVNRSVRAYNQAMLLKLKDHDPQRELEFELDFQLSLTTEQRFEMMRRESRRVLETLIRHGHRKPFEIVKRPCR
jgi:hypothetical protein